MKRLLIPVILFLVLPFFSFARTYMEWVDEADKYIKAREWSKAEEALLNALRSEPANAQNSLLLSNLGTVQRYAGKYQEALQSYTNGLLMTPRSATLYRNRAALYAEMDSLDRALDDYNQVVLLDDKDEDALYRRGLIRLEKKDTAACRRDFEQILKLNPASSDARIGLAMLLKYRHYYPEAIDLYSQVIKMNPGMASLYEGRAEAYIKASQLSKADHDVAKAMELDKDDPLPYVLRAMIKKARFEDAAARKDLETAVKMGYDRQSAENMLKE